MSSLPSLLILILFNFGIALSDVHCIALELQRLLPLLFVMNSSFSSEDPLVLQEQLREHDVHLDGDRVHWNDTSKDHPRNWGPWSRYYTVVLISWLELFMTGMSSSGVCSLAMILNGD